MSIPQNPFQPRGTPHSKRDPATLPMNISIGFGWEENDGTGPFTAESSEVTVPNGPWVENYGTGNIQDYGVTTTFPNNAAGRAALAAYVISRVELVVSWLDPEQNWYCTGPNEDGIYAISGFAQFINGKPLEWVSLRTMANNSDPGAPLIVTEVGTTVVGHDVGVMRGQLEGQVFYVG